MNQMAKMVNHRRLVVSPSILSADFARLADEIAAVEKAGADMIHVDVMDGCFVPNITIGPVVLEKIRKVTRLPLDVHLMVSEPGRYVADFIRAGADTVGIHVEACVHLHRTVQQIREASIKFSARDTLRSFDDVVPSVALNPHTPIVSIENIVGDVGMFIVMTVNPGFGGQKFIESCLPKIVALKKLIAERGQNIPIQVDGGVNTATVAGIVKAGANVLVAGAAVFSTGDYRTAIESIKNAATRSC